MSNLGEEYPKELQRCRELLKMYVEMGAPGMFAAISIQNVIQRAERANTDQNLIAMLSCFQEMIKCE